MDQENISLSQKLKALAEPRRLEIIALLMQGRQCNCEMGEKLSMAPNLLSHHLRVLSQSGLIETQRNLQDARWVYYSIAPAAVTALLDELQDLLDLSKIGVGTTTCGVRRKKISAEPLVDITPKGMR